MSYFLLLALKSSFILIITIIIFRINKKASSNFKHWIISLTLIGLLGLPLFIKIIPPLTWEVEKDSFLSTISVTIPSSIEGEGSPTVPKDQSFIATPEISSLSLTPEKTSFIQKSTLFLSFLLIGSLFFLARFFLGLRKVFLLTKHSQTLSLDTLNKIPSTIKIKSSAEVNTPMTWGFLRSIILLPEQAKHWPKSLLETVLTHELMHIKRADYLIHCLSKISVALYWWNPLVWILSNWQQTEREKACDELVLKAGLSNITYSEHLLAVAKDLSSQTAQNIQYALPMAQKFELKERIQAALKFKIDQFKFNLLNRFQWASFYSISILIIALIIPVEKTAFAQEISKLLSEKVPSLSPPTNQRASISFTQEEDAPKQAAVFEPIAPLPPLKIETIELEKAITLEPTILKTTELDTSNSKLPESTQEPIQTKVGRYYTYSYDEKETKIWTFGEAKFLPEYPYLSLDHIPGEFITIEETDKSGTKPKTHRLVIFMNPTKAKNRIGGGRKDIPYPEEFILYNYNVNGKQKGVHVKRNKWMANKLKETADFLANQKPEQEVNLPVNLSTWREKLEFLKIKVLPKYLFLVPYKWNLPLDRPEATENPLIFPIPFSIKILGTKPKIIKAGTYKKSNISKRNIPLHVGDKKGSLINYLPEGRLIDFNFYGDFQLDTRIDFELHLIGINHEGISKKLNESPILFHTQSGNNWNRVDLSSYQFATSSAILAILEVKGIENSNSKYPDLFLTLSGKKHYLPYKILDKTIRDFDENHFAFYFNIEATPFKKK